MGTEQAYRISDKFIRSHVTRLARIMAYPIIVILVDLIIATIVSGKSLIFILQYSAVFFLVWYAFKQQQTRIWKKRQEQLVILQPDLIRLVNYKHNISGSYIGDKLNEHFQDKAVVNSNQTDIKPDEIKHLDIIEKHGQIIGVEFTSDKESYLLAHYEGIGHIADHLLSGVKSSCHVYRYEKKFSLLL